MIFFFVHSLLQIYLSFENKLYILSHLKHKLDQHNEMFLPSDFQLAPTGYQLYCTSCYPQFKSSYFPDCHPKCLQQKGEFYSMGRELSNNSLQTGHPSSKVERVFYLPVYVRLKLKSFNKISYSSNTVNMCVDLYITIGHEGVDEELVERLVEEGIRIRLLNCQNVCLDEKDLNISLVREREMLHFTVSQFVGGRLEFDKYIAYSPFELINCIVSLAFNHVHLLHDHRAYQFHFNVMNHHNIDRQLTTEGDTNFGLFSLATAKLQSVGNKNFAHYDEKYVEKKQAAYRKSQPKGEGNEIIDEESVGLTQAELFPEGLESRLALNSRDMPVPSNCNHFVMPIYKHPQVAILTIFLPLLFLAVLNIGIFYQDHNLHDRILNISALMISFAALIPVIRAQIPPTSKITYIGMLIYLETLTTIFALFQSLILQNSNPGTLYQLAQNGFFIISLIITVAVNVTVVVLLLVHFFKWKAEYERNLPDGELFIKNIVREEWFNHECDEEFGTFKNSIQKVQGELQENKVINDYPFESTTSKLFAVEVRSREENIEDSS